MTIQSFFDQTIVARRLKTSSGYKKSFQATATADVHVQDIGSQARQRLGILDQRLWVMYISIDDAYQPAGGDQITGDDGKIYKVIDVTRKDYQFGINQYTEVILAEYNE